MIKRFWVSRNGKFLHATAYAAEAIRIADALVASGDRFASVADVMRPYHQQIYCSITKGGFAEQVHFDRRGERVTDR